jgi:hypothetical protein
MIKRANKRPSVADVKKALAWLKKHAGHRTWTAKEILLGTYFGKCWSCNAPVGIIHVSNIHTYNEPLIHHVNVSVPTCFEGVLTCHNCEGEFVRQPAPESLE